MQDEWDTQVVAGQKLETAFEVILDALTSMGYDIAEDENFKGTAERAAKGFAELVLPPAYIEEQVKHMVTKEFTTDDADGMVHSRNTFAVGLCPHHLLPVAMRIIFAYVPEKRVLGVSKISRIAKLMARQPMLQETLTTRIARTIYEGLHAKGAAVMIHATHMCMALRGVESHETVVTTSKLYGIFKTQYETRQEFMDMCVAPLPRIF